MKFLRNFLDNQEKHFVKDGKLKRYFPLYEAIDTFLYSSGKVTVNPSHIRDAIDLKRLMMIVVIALLPAVYMALYNTGYQANLVLINSPDVPGNWQRDFIAWLGIGFNPSNIWANLIHGALYFLPVYAITMAVGGFWEVLFAVVRKHEINEGFLVTGLLFPFNTSSRYPLLAGSGWYLIWSCHR